MFDFAAARHNMVEGQLRTNDVTDLRILAAMDELPRERFVPVGQREFAYIDEDILLKPGGDGRLPRYLMKPAGFGKLVQLAGITAADRVLDIGCATGYGAAVLSRFAGCVVALEDDPDLRQAAESALPELGIDRVRLVSGPLELGHPPAAPYDVILLEGAAEILPAHLLDQLAEGGRLIAVLGRSRAAKAMRYVRADGEISGFAAFDYALHLLPGFARAPSFTF